MENESVIIVNGNPLKGCYLPLNPTGEDYKQFSMQLLHNLMLAAKKLEDIEKLANDQSIGGDYCRQEILKLLNNK